MNKKGFDNKRYVEAQTKAILSRVKKFGKLYLEFGGKLYGDFHASRVLPGYHPDAKIEVLRKIGDSEIIFCISAKDIQKGKIRGDFGLTYDNAALKMIRDLRKFGLDVSAVVINRFANEPLAIKFKKFLDKLKIRAYLQAEIQGYPADVKKILSDEGYGKNPYIPTRKKIVVVTGVGPGSGKMSTCLSQLYFDSKKGIKLAFAKFETFPIWNLPLEHPVNIAYEAATADIGDFNMVDSFHLEAYGVKAINYNRDIENFNIMRSILEKVSVCPYKSPTDMTVSMTKEGIINDAVVREVAKQEIIRRYFRYKKELARGIGEEEVVKKVERLMLKLNLKPENRKVVVHAREAAREARKKDSHFFCGSAIELPNGKIIKGKSSKLLHAESATMLNAIKELAKIPDKIKLLPERIIQNVNKLKKGLRASESLNVEEVMIALSISAATNPSAAFCLKKLKELKNCDMHSTHLPSQGDESGLRKLGINITTDCLQTENIYFGT